MSDHVADAGKTVCPVCGTGTPVGCRHSGVDCMAAQLAAVTKERDELKAEVKEKVEYIKEMVRLSSEKNRPAYDEACTKLMLMEDRAIKAESDVERLCRVRNEVKAEVAMLRGLFAKIVACAVNTDISDKSFRKLAWFELSDEANESEASE